jgi:rhodanese-related sulfurtransferase
VSIAAQALRLCTVAILGTLALGLTRGIPRLPPAPKTESGVAACHAPEPALPGETPVRFIGTEQARALAGTPGVMFVDCRPVEQFEEGHVSGAIHAPLPKVQVPRALLDSLTGAATVITYCDAAGASTAPALRGSASSQCERSLKMAHLLIDAGLHDVRVLEGGMPAWLQHGFPAESGTCAQCGEANQ